MSLKYSSTLFLFFMLLFFSCNVKEDKVSTSGMDLFSVERIGEVKKDSYIFCSIVAEKVDYSYRIGTWTFLTRDGVKIAEGSYDVKYIKDQWKSGGCPISYYYSTWDVDKWKFWNTEGKPIQPTQQLINLINFNTDYERTITF